MSRRAQPTAPAGRRFRSAARRLAARFRPVFAVLAFVTLVLSAGMADARPGGGNTFRSRSSSRSSSSRSSWSPSSSSRSRSYSSSSSSRSSSSSYSASPPPPPQPKFKPRTAGAEREDRLRLGKGKTNDPMCRGKRCEPFDATKGEHLNWSALHYPGVFELDFYRGLGSDGRAIFLGLTIVIPLVIAGIVFFIRRKIVGKSWSSAPERPTTRAEVRQRPDLRQLAGHDPDFSEVVFLDFVQGLFVAARRAQGDDTLHRLAPYLRPNVRAALQAARDGPVSDVIIGALAVEGLWRNQGYDSVNLRITANVRQQRPDGKLDTWYSEEVWTLCRAAGVRTRPPESARVLRCPSCGAGLEKVVQSQCGQCNQVVDTGAFDWCVTNVAVKHRERHSPVQVGAHAPEVGTSSPTVVDAGLPAGLAGLRHTGFDDAAFNARVTIVFNEMQVAWSTLAWDKARPYLTRVLWENTNYWIEAYRDAGLRNITEKSTIERVDYAAARVDRWYDTLTVRLHATGLDYTLRRSDNKIVGGSKTQPRRYTEYWTFIRGRAGGTQASSCPSCGAGLHLSASGECSYCKNKVDQTHFDWTLARIDQDEDYG